MDFDLPEDVQLLQSAVREFADRDVAPFAAALDENEEFPEGPIQKAAEQGFLSLLIPERYGGGGMGNLAAAIVVEEVSRVCDSTGVTISVHNSLVSTPVTKYGSEDLKQRYLPRLATGELLGAYALSEPDCGSDAAALTCRAVKKDDHFLLSGSKLWVTSGTHAGVFLVFARTTKEPGHKARGITAFLIDRDTPGFRVGKKEDKLGIRASTTTSLHMEDCPVPAHNVLGAVDDGFKIAMETLDGGRIGIASQALGITQGCLDAAVAYAKDRQQFGRPIGDFQAIQWKIAEMATRLDAARLLTRRAAHLRDLARPCTTEAAMAKLFASRLANEAADDAVQIHGSAGYSREYPVERLFRDARITEIYEGTTEIQRLVIARAALR